MHNVMSSESDCRLRSSVCLPRLQRLLAFTNIQFAVLSTLCLVLLIASVYALQSLMPDWSHSKLADLPGVRTVLRMVHIARLNLREIALMATLRAMVVYLVVKNRAGGGMWPYGVPVLVFLLGPRLVSTLWSMLRAESGSISVDISGTSMEHSVLHIAVWFALRTFPGKFVGLLVCCGAAVMFALSVVWATPQRRRQIAKDTGAFFSAGLVLFLAYWCVAKSLCSFVAFLHACMRCYVFLRFMAVCVPALLPALTGTLASRGTLQCFSWRSFPSG